VEIRKFATESLQAALQSQVRRKAEERAKIHMAIESHAQTILVIARIQKELRRRNEHGT